MLILYLYFSYIVKATLFYHFPQILGTYWLPWGVSGRGRPFPTDQEPWVRPLDRLRWGGTFQVILQGEAGCPLLSLLMTSSFPRLLPLASGPLSCAH